jgi:hypothetical protein
MRAIIRQAPIYKMSLGKSGMHEKEALASGTLILDSEAALYQATIQGNDIEIQRSGRRLVNETYPKGGAPDAAIGIWRKTIGTFRTLPSNSLVIHWEAKLGHLYWGIPTGEPKLVREEKNEWGQDSMVFNRPLDGGWHKATLGEIPLTNLHPKARDLAINQATLDEVKTDTEFFRQLITDGDTSPWTSRPDWIAKAKETAWVPKDVKVILAGRQKLLETPMIQEAADYLDAEIARMAGTSVQTAAYANGQIVTVTVKAKELGFTRGELEQEIAALLKAQSDKCALTGFLFVANQPNPHLKMSLDRKDSSLGYVPGNVQVVTRAANFFKSASGASDWELKAKAIEKMAIAMQRARKKAAVLGPELANA